MDNIDISALTAEDVKSLIVAHKEIISLINKSQKRRYYGLKVWEHKILHISTSVIQQCEKTTPHVNPVKNMDDDTAFS